MSGQTIHFVPFITVDDEEPDLVVSFALGPMAERSLTLLRTPLYEPLLDESERGVSVGTGASTKEQRNLLIAVHWLNGQALVVSASQEFRLDLSKVDPDEIEEAKTMLEKMNFDKRFQIHAA
jgi:hypothetical protein